MMDLAENWTEEDLVLYGAILDEVEGLEAWQVLRALLDRLIREVGRKGLRDKTHDREWWIGYQEGLEDLLRNIDHVRKVGGELARAAKVEVPRVRPISKSGQGNFAT